jgi:hypothetical protein
VLYISTSERVLRTPFAGRNRRFSSFFVKKEGKKTNYNTKTPEIAVFFSVWELLPKAGRDFAPARKVLKCVNLHTFNIKMCINFTIST